MSSKRLVMVGCCEYGWYLVRDLLEAGVRFDYFVCLTPEQGQRHQVSGYRDYSELAKAYNIPVYHPERYSLKSPRDLAFFQEHRFDVLIQGGWQRLFPQEVLQTLGIGAIGVHGSADFLPKGRGRSPLNWSIIEGKKRFILSLFLIQAGVDDGPVFDYLDFDINDFDTIRTLYYKLHIVSRTMLLRSLPKLLSGTAEFKSQTGQPSYYAKRTPEDGWVDWENMDVWQIYNLIRAVTEPYPGAFANIEGQTYKIWQAQVFDTRISYPEARYGQVVERFEMGWLINCRGGLLLITHCVAVI